MMEHIRQNGAYLHEKLTNCQKSKYIMLQVTEAVGFCEYIRASSHMLAGYINNIYIETVHKSITYSSRHVSHSSSRSHGLDRPHAHSRALQNRPHNLRTLQKGNIYHVLHPQTLN